MATLDSFEAGVVLSDLWPRQRTDHLLGMAFPLHCIKLTWFGCDTGATYWSVIDTIALCRTKKSRPVSLWWITAYSAIQTADEGDRNIHDYCHLFNPSWLFDVLLESFAASSPGWIKYWPSSTNGNTMQRYICSIGFALRQIPFMTGADVSVGINMLDS